MFGRQYLVELGERIAEDGAHRHEEALQWLAEMVETHSPGAAAVLRDRAATSVLRERAFGVAVDAVLRSQTRPEPSAASGRDDEELQQLLLDWQGQLAGWGA